MKRFLHAGEGYAVFQQINLQTTLHQTDKTFTDNISLSSPTTQERYGLLVRPWFRQAASLMLVALVYLKTQLSSCNFSVLRTSCIYLGLFFMCLQAVIAKEPPVPETDRAVLVASPFSPDSIQPLQVGDKVPDYLWDLPLEVVNHAEGKATMTLAEYRGKMILLDFLSSGCASCIQAIPELEMVVYDFEPQASIIAITSETMERMTSFVPNNPYTKSSTTPFVVADQVLQEHFPHLTISHVVWIDQWGYVRGFTGTAHVRESTLWDLAVGHTSNWPVKVENTSFYNSALVESSGNDLNLPNNARRSLYYSLITGFTEGVGSYIPTTQDTLQGITRYSLRNRSILDLYLIAVDRLYKLSPDQIIWEVESPSTFDLLQADLSEMTLPQWYQRYALCYEATFPLNASTDQIKSRMRTDLNHFLQLDGRLEQVNGQEVFILTDIKSN